MEHTLIIRHFGDQHGKPEFNVVRQADAKTGAAVILTPPERTVVKGRPDSDLTQDLRWYLEHFLDYPFDPNTQLAERVLEALKGWGEQIFTQLFQGHALLWYDKARNDGLTKLHLKIASDDPRILAWPWEALHDPQGTTLAQTCRIERQLGELHDPLPLTDTLSRDRIHILLIIARPYGETDVSYHALSRPLVELSRSERLAVHIDVLRPPTFTQLRRVLHEKPGVYHIVHFDGHGGYGGTGQAGSPYRFEAPQGRLIFEDEQGEDFPVIAEKLSELLSEYRIPIMVLNACQSARINERAQDPFASVAAALLKAGIRSVVAIGYNLYVSGAQQFVPAFYRRLIETGQIAEAVRAGRQAMQEQDARVCVRGEFPLQDWLVPVLYQQEPIVLPGFKETHTLSREVHVPSSETLPEEALELGDYGFIGRDRAIQSLERARLRQKQAAVLIHGMAGVGKTTLARGFLHWLRDSHGLGAGVFWFAFDAIHSAEYVINRLVEGLFEPHASALPLEKKLEALIATLREDPFLIIWDNFESAAGIPGTEVTPLLPEEDCQRLKTLLQQLRGGKTKILITSRSPENWLSPTECYRLPLGGLIGEQRWAYCNAVVRDLGLRIDREDALFMELMQVLDGHPLATRAVLLRLQERPAQALLEEWQSGFEGAAGDESARRIFAALSLLIEGLPAAYAPLLQLIGLHQRYVQIVVLEAMCQTAETPVEKSTLNGCITALENGGLLHHRGQGIYTMHSALSGFLHQHHPASEPLQRSFVDVMGSIADKLTPRQLHEQLIPFIRYGASFHSALSLAGKLCMDSDITALMQSLAAFAKNDRDFATAMRLFVSLSSHMAAVDNQKGVAIAYHQLGVIAEEQRDFASAAKWYQRSLNIKEKLGNERGATITYHQLGMIAQKQRDFTIAAKWYQKSLDIDEKFGNEHGAAITYYNLGGIAEEQHDFTSSAKWYQKSLNIREKLGDEHGAAMTYHQLGRIAEEQRDFASAAQWYQKSLDINEKLGDEHGAAMTYHQLGMIAEKQRDFASAAQWYQKSLDIEETLGDEHGASITYGQLGLLSQAQGEYRIAGEWFLKAIAGFSQTDDQHSLGMAVSAYARNLQAADESSRATLRERWHVAGLDELISIDELEKTLNESTADTG